MYKCTLYAELDKAITRAGLSHSDIALSLLNCSESTFSKIMNGKRPFSAAEIAIMSSALDIPFPQIYDVFIRPYAELHREELYIGDWR